VAFVGDLRAVLRQPQFRRLYAARLISQASDGAFQVALGAYVFFSPERQTTAGKAAAAFAILLLPYSLVGPFAGVFLDRWRRQRVLVRANLVRALGIVALTGLVGLDADGPAFFALALAVLSVNRFYLAALSAALPHVVRSDELVMANSVSTTSGTVVAVVGGGLGVLLRAVAGGGTPGAVTVLAVAAGCYLVSSFVASGFPADLLGPDRDQRRPQAREALRSVLRGLVDGGRHVWSRPRAGYAMAAITAHRFCYGLSTIAVVLLYRNYFHDSADVNAGLAGLAGVFALSGVGYFVAAVLTPPVTQRIGKERWSALLYLVAGATQLAFGLPYTQRSFLVAAFVLGVVAQGVKICVDSEVQQSVEDAFRGRVFSFYDVAFNVAFVGAAAFGALALPSSGKSYPVLGIVAAGYALTGLTYRWAIGRLDEGPLPEAGRIAPAATGR
jgi:MFS family permease